MSLSSKQLQALRKDQKRRAKKPPGDPTTALRPVRGGRVRSGIRELTLEADAFIGPVSMSDVLLHVAEPLLEEHGDSPAAINRLLLMASAGWNIASAPPKERQPMFDRLAANGFGGDAEAVAVFRWICDVVAERKREFYPHLQRFIENVIVSNTDRGLHVNVVSTLELRDATSEL